MKPARVRATLLFDRKKVLSLSCSCSSLQCVIPSFTEIEIRFPAPKLTKILELYSAAKLLRKLRIEDLLASRITSRPKDIFNFFFSTILFLFFDRTSRQTPVSCQNARVGGGEAALTFTNAYSSRSSSHSLSSFFFLFRFFSVAHSPLFHQSKHREFSNQRRFKFRLSSPFAVWLLRFYSVMVYFAGVFSLYAYVFQTFAYFDTSHYTSPCESGPLIKTSIRSQCCYVRLAGCKISQRTIELLCSFWWTLRGQDAGRSHLERATISGENSILLQKIRCVHFISFPIRKFYCHSFIFTFVSRNI